MSNLIRNLPPVTACCTVLCVGMVAGTTFANPVDPLSEGYPAHSGLNEIISQGTRSINGGIFSQGMAGSGPWAGEILSQGMQMSNGIVYSQGMQINYSSEESSFPALDDDPPVPPGMALTTPANTDIGSDPASSPPAIALPPGTAPQDAVPLNSGRTTDGGNDPPRAPTSIGATVETSRDDFPDIGTDPVTVLGAAEMPGSGLGFVAGGSDASSNPIPAWQPGPTRHRAVMVWTGIAPAAGARRLHRRMTFP